MEGQEQRGRGTGEDCLRIKKASPGQGPRVPQGAGSRCGAVGPGRASLRRSQRSAERPHASADPEGAQEVWSRPNPRGLRAPPISPPTLNATRISSCCFSWPVSAGVN